MTYSALHVLLIGDNAGEADFTRAELGKVDAGKSIQLYWVASLEQGLEHLAKHEVSAILLDVSLAHEFCVDAVKRILNRAPSMPVVIIAEEAYEQAATQAIQAGAQDYLIKGQMDGRLLLHCIQYAIRRKQTEMQLTDALEFSKSILTSSPVGILTYKLTGECLSANDYAAQMVGTTVESLIRQNFRELASWKKSGLYDLAEKAIASGELAAADVHIITTFNKDVWFRAQFVTFKSAGEELLLFTIGDITEHKLAENALRESEARYRLALQATNDVIWEWNSKSKHLTWSENAQLVFGYAQEEIGLDESWWDEHIHPEDRQRVISRLDALLESSATIWSEEYRFLIKDGSYAYISDHGYIERDDTGAVIRMIGAMSNVTERQRAEQALKVENERFLRFVNSDIVGIAIADSSGKIMLANDYYLNLLGVTRQDFFDGKVDWRKFTPSEWLPADEKAIRELHERGVCEPYEKEYERPDGTRVPVYIADALLGGPEEQIVAFVLDITKQKQTEEAIKQSEKRFRALIENGRDNISLLDKNGILLWENPSIVRPLGYPPNEHVGRNILQLMHPDDLERVTNAFMQLLQEPWSNQSDIFRLRHNDGRWRWVEAIASNLLEEASVQAVVINYRDITERKQAEDALQESELRYKTLVNQLPVIVYIDDVSMAKGQTKFVSPQIERMLGYTPEEWIKGGNELWENSIHHDDRERVLDEYQRCAETGEELDCEYRVAAKNGKLIWVHDQSTTLKDEHDQPRLIHGIVHDITQAKQLEGSLQERERRYRSLFEDSPISLWEEDFSEVKKRLDGLRKTGISDFRTYFMTHPQFVAECASLVRIVDVNKAAVELFQANAKEDLIKNLSNVLSDESHSEFAEELIHIAEGDTQFGWEGINRTMKGERLDISLTWSLVPGYEEDLSRVIISIADVTEQKRAEAAIRDSETRYRTLMEKSLEAIYLYDLETRRLVTANPAFLNLLGYGLEEALELTIYDVVAQDRSSIDGYLQQIQSEGGLSMGERFWRRKDGTTFPVEVTANKIRQSDRDLIFVVARDITERKAAELALRNAEDKYRSIFENAVMGIYQTTPDGKYVSANPALAHMFGYGTPEDLIASLTDLNHQFYVESNRRDEFRRALIDQDTIAKFESEVYRKDGSTMWISENARAVHDKAGNLLYYEGTTENITARKQAEAALQKSEIKYRNLVETSHDLIWAVDAEGRITYLNQASKQVYGYEPEELIGRSFFDVMDPEHYHQDFNLLKKNLGSADKFVGIESIVKRKDGSQRILSANSVVLRDSQGKIIGLSGSSHDITERKLAEIQIKQRLSELEAIQRVSTVLRAAESLKEMLSQVLDETLAVINTEAGTIKLYDPTSNSLVSVASRGWYKDIENVVVRPGEGTSGTVFASGKPYLAREFVTDPVTMDNARPRIPSGWGGACIPIRSGQITTGVLFVAVPLPRQLTQADINLLNTLAEMAGSAIHRMQLHEETLQQLERLNALQEIDRAISSSFDLRLTLEIVISQVIRLLKVDAADILLIPPEAFKLEFASGKGFLTSGIKSTRLGLGEGLPGTIARELRTVQIENLADMKDRFDRHDVLAGENFVSYVGVPLVVKGKIKGVLEIFHRSLLKPEPGWVKFLETLAGQAAIAIDNSLLFQDVQRSNTELVVAYDATIEGWVSALDLRYKEAEGHSERVTQMTLQLARLMGIRDDKLIHLRRGALLHDIGKMVIPDHVLLNTGELSPDYQKLIRLHPQYAYDILSPIFFLKEAMDIPYCHHERWNGTGYPRGLKGEQIPLAARIFAVVDVWDSLTSDRPYRSAWSKSKARKYLIDHSGIYFDAKIVETFLKMITDEQNG